MTLQQLLMCLAAGIIVLALEALVTQFKRMLNRDKVGGELQKARAEIARLRSDAERHGQTFMELKQAQQDLRDLQLRLIRMQAPPPVPKIRAAPPPPTIPEVQFKAGCQ